METKDLSHVPLISVIYEELSYCLGDSKCTNWLLGD